VNGPIGENLVVLVPLAGYHDDVAFASLVDGTPMASARST
jgi:hypothetical protein